MKDCHSFFSIYIYLMICLFIVSCKNDGVPTVNVAQSMNNTDDVGIEEIVSDVQVVKLKCDSLYDITVFGEYDGCLYGKTVDNIMVIFSGEGQLLYKIDRRGRGPGEYVNPLFHFDYYRGEILVLDALNKVLRYDRNGAFVEEISNNAVKAAGDIVPLSADAYLATVISGLGPDSSLMYLDDDFNVTGYTMPVFNEAQLSREGVTVMERLWYYNSSVMYQPFGEEEYYRYSDGRWMPYLRVNEGRYRMPAELLTAVGMEDKQAEYIMPYRSCISGRYFLYSYTILDRMAIYFDIFDIAVGLRVAHNVYTEEDMMSGTGEGFFFRYDGCTCRIFPQYVWEGVMYWSQFDDDGTTTLFKLFTKSICE